MADVNAMPKTDDFANQLAKEFKSATVAGRDYVDIRSGCLHDMLVSNSGPNHRMPACCNAMCAAKGNDDKVLESPPSGQGRNLVIRYRIPR